MRIHFSIEDRQGWERTLYMRAALLKWGHTVTVRTPFSGSAPPETDLWMHGLGWDPRPPMRPGLLRDLRAFRGQIAFFQCDDDLSIHTHRIPDDLRSRAAMYLRNQWAADEALLPEDVRRARRGFLTPLVRYAQPIHAGAPLSERRRVAVFYGAGTGSPTNGTAGARARTVRLLRDSGLPFEGGLVEPGRHHYDRPSDLSVPRISQRDHARVLCGARICVAPWGNNQLTYRLYEGLAYRCLVVAQSLRAIRFVDMGLTPGVHYVEVAEDLSDLVEKVEHYLHHDAEAQRIADAGYEHCRRYFRWPGMDVPDPLIETVLASWGDLLRPVQRRSLSSRLLRAALPALPYL